jgi:hypothetical protein
MRRMRGLIKDLTVPLCVTAAVAFPSGLGRCPDSSLFQQCSSFINICSVHCVTEQHPSLPVQLRKF